MEDLANGKTHELKFDVRALRARLFRPDVVASRKDDTRVPKTKRMIGIPARSRILRRVLLRTIYDSNRRYSQRPTVNANMRYTWAHCGTAWQIQSKLYYAHSVFVTRCIVCRHLGPPSSSSCSIRFL